MKELAGAFTNVVRTNPPHIELVLVSSEPQYAITDDGIPIKAGRKVEASRALLTLPQASALGEGLLRQVMQLTPRPPKPLPVPAAAPAAEPPAAEETEDTHTDGEEEA